MGRALVSRVSKSRAGVCAQRAEAARNRAKVFTGVLRDRDSVTAFRGRVGGVRSWESGVRSEESGVGSQESGVRSRESGVRSEESGVRGMWGRLTKLRVGRLPSRERFEGRISTNEVSTEEVVRGEGVLR